MPWGNVDGYRIPKAFECPPGQEPFNELLFRKRKMRRTTKWRGAFFVLHYMPSLYTLLCLLPLCEIRSVNLNAHCLVYGRVQMTSANVSKSYYGRGKRRTEANLSQVKSSVCPIVILNCFKSVQMNRRDNVRWPWGGSSWHLWRPSKHYVLNKDTPIFSFVHHLWNACIAKRYEVYRNRSSGWDVPKEHQRAESREDQTDLKWHL